MLVGGGEELRGQELRGRRLLEKNEYFETDLHVNFALFFFFCFKLLMLIVRWNRDMMRRRMQIRVAWLLCAGQPSTASARRSVKRHWASRVPFRAAHTGLARHSTSKQLTKHLHFHFKEGNMSPMSSLQSQRSTCVCMCTCMCRVVQH